MNCWLWRNIAVKGRLQKGHSRSLTYDLPLASYSIHVLMSLSCVISDKTTVMKLSHSHQFSGHFHMILGYLIAHLIPTDDCFEIFCTSGWPYWLYRGLITQWTKSFLHPLTLKEGTAITTAHNAARNNSNNAKLNSTLTKCLTNVILHPAGRCGCSSSILVI